MINGMCHTNLDDYKREQWPMKFVAVPRIGASVKSKSGKILKVVDITYSVMEANVFDPMSCDPIIIVELHKG
jgi:hypothetical protein